MPRAELPAGPGLASPHAWFLLHQPGRYYAWLRRRYGEIATLRLPGSTAVTVLTSEGARQVFSADPDGYDPFLKDGYSAIAGPRAIWVLAGQDHQRERQLLLAAFHPRQGSGYGQVIKEVTTRHIDAWQPDQSMRAYDALLDISRDVILRIVFGLDHGAALDEGRSILTSLLNSGHPLAVFIPAFRAGWFRPWRRFKRAKDEFSRFIARRIVENSPGETRQRDVFGTMLAARLKAGDAAIGERIDEELIPVLLAGYQTTAVGLAWALYELHRHPAVLARLRNELDALGPDPDPELLVKQPYLRAVCDETLRLHTIVAEVARITRLRRELLGHAVPPGTGVAVSISAIHHDSSLYPAPDEFRPERFLERSYGPFEYLPFGGGHRRCPGAALSDYEMAITLAIIVARWELELAGAEREVRHNIATGPKHGVRIRLKGRRSVTPADNIAGA
jgi:cytochrome P450 family 110